MFGPVSALAIICMLRYLPIYKQIQEYCGRRNMCRSACTQENFPHLTCVDRQLELEYNGDMYKNFFVYPKPTGEKPSPLYEECASFIDDNPDIPWTVQGEMRQLKMHSCFKACKANADCLLGFDMDQRDDCRSGNEINEMLLCVSPETECEVYVEKNDICLNSQFTFCLNWHNIWLAILILNVFQLIFESALYFALETSLKPTVLDKLENEELEMDNE